MKRLVCIYPSLVEEAMTEFIAFASDLEYTDEEGNTFKQMPTFYNIGEFGANVGEYSCDEPTFEISYCIESLMTKGMKQFRKDFTNRSPKAKGFATITLSLLHELGHFETMDEDDDDEYDRMAEIKRILALPVAQRNWEYFKLPDEFLATSWAIEWLNRKENRIAAKQFEKKFFSCFA